MLDLFFRKYAWTANLVLVFAAAWLTAKTVNTLVGAAIRPTPQVDLSATSPTSLRSTIPTTLDVDKLYRLIGQEPPAEASAEAQAPAAPQNCNDRRATPTRSDLRLALAAAVLAEPARYSLATIVDLGSHEAHVLGVGDEVGGARLLGLERVRAEGDATGNGFRVVAVVCNRGTKEYLEFEGGAAPASTGPDAGNLGVSGVPPPARPGAPVAGVRETGPNRYEVDRSLIESTMSNLNAIATQARIVPSFKNGVANGFKLFSVQPGSFYSSIGIENGDVVQRINGYELNSPEKMLELYQKLASSKQVSLEVERGGQTIRKEYNISDR